MSERRLYSVVMRDYEIKLVGPFSSIDEMEEWNRGFGPNNPNDDPRWQSIELTDEQVNAPLPLVKP